jgi:hypothetical protein
MMVRAALAWAAAAAALSADHVAAQTASCNPKASPPELCPGNLPCPECGAPACACPPTPPHPPSCPSCTFNLTANLTSNMRLPTRPSAVTFTGFGAVNSSLMLLGSFPPGESGLEATVGEDGRWRMKIAMDPCGPGNITFQSVLDSLQKITLTNVSFGDGGSPARRGSPQRPAAASSASPAQSVERRALQSQACPSCSAACDDALSSACHLMFGSGKATNPARFFCRSSVSPPHAADLTVK